MLFWNDSQLALELAPSWVERSVFLFVLALLLLACLCAVLLEVWFLLPMGVFLGHSAHYWHVYLKHDARKASKAFVCKQGQCSIIYQNGRQIDHMRLNDFFIGRYFIVMTLLEKSSGKEDSRNCPWCFSAVRPKRHYLVLWPDQMGESSFRHLVVLLRYRASCFSTDVRA